MSFNFNTTTPKTAATGFTLPASNTPTTSSTGFQLNTGSGDNKTLPNKPTLFGVPTTSTNVGTGGALPFGTPSSTAAPSLNFGVGTGNTSTLNFGAPVNTSAPLNFSLSGPVTTAASTTAATSFTPILSTTAATSTGLTLGSIAPTTTSAAPALSFGLSASTTSATPSLGLSTSTAVSSTVSTAPATTIPATGSLTFTQLEDSINKWTIDLEEQGKFFINQAKQLNAWDTLLISNGEKIMTLNSSIERVKQQQTQLDQELDFVLAQQRELEELITPLEKELIEIPVTDIDRNQMYQFSEIIDSQLKQMSEDLKEIIEHINEAHKEEESSNPISQIGRILNAHMNSLQWIDRNTAQVSAHLEQLTKIQDANRKNLSLNHSFNM